MKIVFLIALAFLSLHCSAFTECFGEPETVSLILKFPGHSLTIISLYALVIYWLCFPVKCFQKNLKIWLPLLELFLILLYGAWYWIDFKYDWTFLISRTWTFEEHFAIFVAYFFFIYKDCLIPFFSKFSESAALIILTSFFFVISISIYLGMIWPLVDCGQELLQIYPISRIMAIFVWTFVPWLFFSRSWKVLITSLPLAYLFFYFGRQVSFFTSGKYYIVSLVKWSMYGPYEMHFRRSNSVEWSLSEWKALLLFSVFFIIQIFAYFVFKLYKRRKRKLTQASSTF